MAILQIPSAIYDAMVAHAKQNMPLEACGYLAGETPSSTPSQAGENGDDPKGMRPLDPAVATVFMPMTNIDKSPEHFTFDPKEQFAAIKQVRQSGESLLAVYHSHPETPARLSAEDVRLFNDPNMIYVIVSLAAAIPEVKAYRVRKHEDVVNIVRVDIVVS
jgi:proteasome lid subunit RPN8/RPN11